MIFSVIIPLYNGAGFIKGALDSVLSQTNRDYEIVICDDGSKDDSGQMVESYIRDHPEVSINYIRQENRGLGGARNTAMNFKAILLRFWTRTISGTPKNWLLLTKHLKKQAQISSVMKKMF